MITNKKTYLLAALGALTLHCVGMHAMQQKTSAQMWYQSQIQSEIKKLNTSFAQLIGASQDFESRETVAKYVEQTRHDLDTVHGLIKQFNWCPGLIDQAVSHIKDKLVISDKTVWTGSYAITMLGKQFTLAQEMKNWLLASCNQLDGKETSVEYGKLRLMALKKDFKELRNALKEERFDRSYEYFDIKDTIKDKLKNKELSWWNDMCVNAHSLLVGNLDDYPQGNVLASKLEQQYKEKLLRQEIQSLEDTLEDGKQNYNDRLNQATEDYHKKFEEINTKPWNYDGINFCKDGSKLESTVVSPLTSIFTPTDELVFKDKQGNYNAFFDVIWQLCNVKSRQDILIGEKYFDSWNPVAYLCDKIATPFVGYETSEHIQEPSLGENISNGAMIADKFFLARDVLGEFPLAAACKCFSMLLACEPLRDAVVLLGVKQEEMDLLVKMKSDCHEYGFSLNDTLKFSQLINEDRLSLIVRLCIKAISKQPEKFARNFDELFKSTGAYLCNKAKTATDDHNLLTYVAQTNKRMCIAPIRAVQLPELGLVESLYASVFNKKTLATLAFIGLIYGSYRSGLPQWLIQKSKELPGSNIPLAALGFFAYKRISRYLKK